jgi:Rrf2 family protein
MILRNHVEWALHCCAVLAGLPAGRYLSTKVLAEFHGVPKDYLSKALQSLSQADMVATVPGPSGGYRLARPAEDLTVLDVVEAVEGRRSTFACTEIRRNNPCRPSDACDARPCSIARIMWQADEAWRQSLRRVKLADIVAALPQDVPAEQLHANMEWLLARR